MGVLTSNCAQCRWFFVVVLTGSDVEVVLVVDVLTLSVVEVVLVCPYLEWLGDRAGGVYVLTLSFVWVVLVVRVSSGTLSVM